MDSIEDTSCKICSTLCSEDSDSVSCDICLKWFHITCGKSTKTDYQKLQAIKSSNVLWICNQCKENLETLRTNLNNTNNEKTNIEDINPSGNSNMIDLSNGSLLYSQSTIPSSSIPLNQDLLSFNDETRKFSPNQNSPVLPSLSPINDNNSHIQLRGIDHSQERTHTHKNSAQSLMRCKSAKNSQERTIMDENYSKFRNNPTYTDSHSSIKTEPF